MTWGTGLRLRFKDIMVRKEMLKAIINLETLEVICPTCNKSNFTIFRRDKVSDEIYFNHSKCEDCGQLFIYNVDRKNNPILEKDKNGI